MALLVYTANVFQAYISVEMPRRDGGNVCRKLKSILYMVATFSAQVDMR